MIRTNLLLGVAELNTKTGNHGLLVRLAGGDDWFNTTRPIQMPIAHSHLGRIYVE